MPDFYIFENCPKQCSHAYFGPILRRFINPVGNLNTFLVFPTIIHISEAGPNSETILEPSYFTHQYAPSMQYGK